MTIRSKTIGAFAGLTSYVVMAPHGVSVESLPLDAPIRPDVSLGIAVSEWRARQLVEEMKKEWQEFRSATAAIENDDWDELKMAKALENVGFAPPVATFPIRVRIQGVKAGQPHSAPMDDFDFELMESLQGEF